MKLKFKKQAYQTNAVDAVADCFAGQLPTSGIQYRVDPGRAKKGGQQSLLDESGFRNSEIALTLPQLLENIHSVQRHQNLPLSAALVNDKKTGCPINLDIEMETGTGKTYCYIKTVFELNIRYGWSKFIVVVPSIAIREGVYKSLSITAEHFLEDYGSGESLFLSKDFPCSQRGNPQKYRDKLNCYASPSRPGHSFATQQGDGSHALQ